MTKTHLYSGFLNLSVFSIVILSLAVMVLVVLLWEYYVPSQKTKTGINFLDGRDPSKLAAPSTTLQSIKQNIVKQPDYLTTLTGTQTNNNNGYMKSQLRQLCSLNNLPAFDNSPDNYLIQNCAPGLCCVANIVEEGSICLSDIGQQCTRLGDCVPSATGCVNNTCVNQIQDNLLDIDCKYDYDCRIDSLEDQKNNHVCVNNICKYNLFPFDMGCRVTEDCGAKDGHQIVCKKFDYENLLFQGTYSNNSVTLDDNSLMNIGYYNNERYLARLKINHDGANIRDISNDFNYIISGTSGASTLILEQIEFSNNDYERLNNEDTGNGVSVYVHFGNMPSDLNKEIGICMDLLPAGAPSNYSIAGISAVPPIVRDIQPQMTIIDDFYAVEGRTGTLFDFCLQNSADLNCGSVTVLGTSRDLSCGYNYLYEEVIMDNIFYGLSARQFDMPRVGSCMLKINDYKEPCDMQLNGCKDPYLCLPVLNPENNTKENYCLTPFRAQICDTGLACPEGYGCSTTSDSDGENLPYCLSSSGNIALQPGDCISNSLEPIVADLNSNKTYLYIYNIDKQKYIRLFPIPVLTYESNSTISNGFNIKISKNYLELNADSEHLSLEKGIKLPKHILIYGNYQITASLEVYLFSLDITTDNAQYILTNNFHLVIEKQLDNPNSSIYDLDLDQDDNVVVIMKNKLESLREFAITLGVPEPVQENNNGEPPYLVINGYLPDPSINQNGPPYYKKVFFNNGMLRDGVTYDCYLYTPEIDKQSFNQICKVRYNNYNNTDKFTITDYPDTLRTYWDEVDTEFPHPAYIFFNTNKFQFPSYNHARTYGAEQHTAAGITRLPADNIGEKWITNPIVYRNKGIINNKEIIDNYTLLEDGDRLKLTESNLSISSVKNFIYEDTLETVSFDQNKYLYVENVQQNYDVLLNASSSGSPLNQSEHEFYNNYIINLHDNFYSSEGSAPVYITTNGIKKFISQNINIGSSSSTNFEVYGDMVNYSFNFIPVDISILNHYSSGKTITLQKPPSFTILNSNDENGHPIRVPNVNGINNSITYNFEEGTSPKFNFSKNGDERSVLIQNTLQGVSSYSTYVQKIKYNHIIGTSPKVNLLKDFLSTDGYDHLFQNTYSYISTNDITNYHQDQIKFSYTDEIIAPHPKSLYFDNSLNTNLIDNVEENLFNASNKFSIQTTFNHGGFIENQGANNQGDDLGINTGNNNYSNKDPPVASYSSYNKFNYDTTVTDSIQYNYDGYDFLNQEKYSYIEVGTSIGPSYRTSGDCVGVQGPNTVLNKITFRTPEIIDLILNNPSSEIVIQKQGPTFKEFYITGGTSTVFSYYDSQATDSTKIPNITNENNLLFDTTSTEQEFNKRIELTRSIISIEEYDVNLDTEYLVVKINAPIDNRDEYQNSVLNDPSKWRFWIHNFCPLTYTLYGNSYLDFRMNIASEKLTLYGDINNEVLTIMDSSCLWGSCKNIGDGSFPKNYSRTSYNKIAFNETEGNDSYFNLFQVHDDYFNVKQTDNGSSPGLCVSVSGQIGNNKDNYDASRINIYNYVERSDNVDYYNDTGRKETYAPSIVDDEGWGWTTFLAYSGQLVLSDIPTTSGNLNMGPHTGKRKLYSNTFRDTQNIGSYSGDVIETFFDIENFYPVLDIFTENYLPSTRENNNDIMFVVSNFWGYYLNSANKTRLNQLQYKNKFFNEYPEYNNWYSLYTDNGPTAKINPDNNNMYITGYHNNDGETVNIGSLQGRYTIFNSNTTGNLVYNNKFLPKKIQIFNNGNNSSRTTFKSNIFSINPVRRIEIFYDSYFVNNYIFKPFIDQETQAGGYWSKQLIYGSDGPDFRLAPFAYGRRDNPYANLYGSIRMYNSDYSNFSIVFGGFHDKVNTTAYNVNKISIVTNILNSTRNINTDYSVQGQGQDLSNLNTKLIGKAVQLTKSLEPGENFPPDEKYINENFIYFKRNYLTPNRDKKIGPLKFHIDPGTSNEKYLNIFGNNKTSSNIMSAADREHPVNFNCRTSYNSFFIFENNNQEDNDTPTSLIEEININVYSGIITSGGTIKYHHLKNKADIYICNNRPSIGNPLMIPLAEFDIRPANSGTISLLDKYQSYSSKLYMVNNLFLSTLPKNISNFRYNGLNIINDYVVSNLFKTNNNNGTSIVTHYKGKGLVKTPINGSVVFSHYFDKINQFNLINYNEVKFPSFFTERFISRFNSIPYIVNIFTSIREGNIFDNFNYYAFINYKAHDSDYDNYQIVYLSTDVTLETTLENRGIPFTKSVSKGLSITASEEGNNTSNTNTNNNIGKLAIFEPVNKFLFVLGYSCN